jgi:ABC-2 type transport system permease protein
MMLSGFLYDPRSMPAGIRAITTVMPARYAVGLMQTLFLAGNIPAVVVPGLAVLAGMAALVLTLTRIATRKRLD